MPCCADTHQADHSPLVRKTIELEMQRGSQAIQAYQTSVAAGGGTTVFKMESAAPRRHFTLHGRLTPSDSAPQTRFSPSFAVQVWFALTRSRMRHRQSSVRPRRLQDSGPPASGPGSECANIASTSSDNIIPATGLRKTLQGTGGMEEWTLWQKARREKKAKKHAANTTGQPAAGQ